MWSILRYYIEMSGDSQQAQSQTDHIMTYILTKRETNKIVHLKRTIT